MTQLTRFEHDLLVDVYLSADAAYWRRRAQEFEEVGTPACDEIARACYARARFQDAARAEADLILSDLERTAA